MTRILLLCTAFTLPSCATLNESLQLGAALGTATGAGATLAAHHSVGNSPSFGDVALGAGIGAGVGVLAAYFTHKDVLEKRVACEADQTEMYFGDLPPSPFIVPRQVPRQVPKPLPKKGGL